MKAAGLITKPKGAKWNIAPGMRLFQLGDGTIQVRKRFGKEMTQIGFIVSSQTCEADCLAAPIINKNV